MRLESKTAIITGAASGMGAEEARLFAREGCKVIVADVSDELGESVVEGGRPIWWRRLLHAL